uniref:Transmembrane protein n=1 Tax=Heterorhabditis bacteriophora TaxID=37862 RepID=A0A1I7X445_HETBA
MEESSQKTQQNNTDMEHLEHASAVQTAPLSVLPEPTMLDNYVYFLFIYFTVGALIAVPLFHLEIFVGQFTQAGIMKAFKMYGYGFEGDEN